MGTKNRPGKFHFALQYLANHRVGGSRFSGTILRRDLGGWVPVLFLLDQGNRTGRLVPL